MKFELKRNIDSFGRIDLHTDLRNHYGFQQGDTLVILPVRNGIHIALSEYFMMDELSDDMITTVDSLGRILVPSVFRNQYRFEPDDILTIIPNETCVLICK